MFLEIEPDHELKIRGRSLKLKSKLKKLRRDWVPRHNLRRRKQSRRKNGCN